MRIASAVVRTDSTKQVNVGRVNVGLTSTVLDVNVMRAGETLDIGVPRNQQHVCGPLCPKPTVEPEHFTGLVLVRDQVPDRA
jgi:hypothetical protein